MFFLVIVLAVLLGASVFIATAAERRRLDAERVCRGLEREASLLRTEIAYLRSSR